MHMKLLKRSYFVSCTCSISLCKDHSFFSLRREKIAAVRCAEWICICLVLIWAPNGCKNNLDVKWREKCQRETNRWVFYDWKRTSVAVEARICNTMGLLFLRLLCSQINPGKSIITYLHCAFSQKVEKAFAEQTLKQMLTPLFHCMSVSGPVEVHAWMNQHNSPGKLELKLSLLTLNRPDRPFHFLNSRDVKSTSPVTQLGFPYSGFTYQTGMKHKFTGEGGERSTATH